MHTAAGQTNPTNPIVLKSPDASYRDFYCDLAGFIHANGRRSIIVPRDFSWPVYHRVVEPLGLILESSPALWLGGSDRVVEGIQSGRDMDSVQGKANPIRNHFEHAVTVKTVETAPNARSF